MTVTKLIQPGLRYLVFLFAALSGCLRATDVSLNSLFSDHMVLQRNQRIRLFGTGVEHSKVIVRLDAHEGRSTVHDGAWEVELPPMTAGGPYTIEIEGPQKLTLKDVMIGDVWVGSGQSNMGIGVEKHARIRQGAATIRESVVPGV